MECQNCHKNGFVIIGNKRYCSNCGSRLDGATVAPRAMSDIKPNTAGPVPAQPAKAPTSIPAAQLHGQQVGSSAPVLDLRAAEVAKTAAKQQPMTQSVAAVSQPVQVPTPAVTPAVTPAPKPPTPVASPRPAGVNAVTAATAAAPTSIIASQPEEQPVRMVAPSTNTGGLHPLVKRFPSHPSVEQKNAQQAQTPTNVPNSVTAPAAATAAEPLPEPTSPALQYALDNTAKVPSPELPQNRQLPSLASAAAAVAAVAIIGGLVWMQNSPKLAFRTAASQAGVQASLPTYVPSSYRQIGPAQASPGQLVLSFQSNNKDGELKIIQRRTAWDTNSLRENYVGRQSDDYTAVQGQGLTIYLFGDRASWVNHGVWYTVEGASKLSREQVLKVAYGL